MSMTELLEEAETFSGPPLPERYEVVNGEIVELPPVSSESEWVASRLNNAIAVHLSTSKTGETVREVLFRLPLAEDTERNRKPDAAYVSYERWPKPRRKPGTNALNIVPDLVIEVASPSDYAEDLIAKVSEYFRAGVRAVWVVFLVAQQVYAYSSPTKVEVVPDSGVLTGGDLLPGLSIPLVDVFMEPPAA